MLEIEIIENVAEMERLGAEWRELLGRAALPAAAQTPGWLLAWWRIFGDDARKLRCVAVFDRGRLIGLVPVLARRALESRVFPFAKLELVGCGEEEADEIGSECLGPIAERGREWAVAEAFATSLAEGQLGAWDELVMPSMMEESPAVPLFEVALRAIGAEVSLEACGACRYARLPKTWGDYVASLGRVHGHAVARALRGLEEWAGPTGYRLVRAEGAAEVERAKRILTALHEEPFRAQGGSGVFASARYRRFHDEAIRALLDGRDGALDLMWLEAQGEPIAATYNVVYDRRSFVYLSAATKNAPDEVRPAIVLHALAIQRAIDLGMREYAFSNGDSPERHELATDAHALVRLRAVAPSVRARALEAARSAADDFAHRLRRITRAA